MIAYKVEILIIDFENLSQEETKDAIENANYAGDCIMPNVMSIEEADIGEWDDHPLNQTDKMKAEFARLFPQYEEDER